MPRSAGRRSGAGWIVGGAVVVAMVVLLLLFRPPQWPAVPDDVSLRTLQGEPFPLSHLSRALWVAHWTDPARPAPCAETDAVLRDLGNALPAEVVRLVLLPPDTREGCVSAAGWRALTAPIDELQALARGPFRQAVTEGSRAADGTTFVVDRGGRVRLGGDREAVLAEVGFLLALDRRPRWHAWLNGTSALLAAGAYLLIRGKRWRAHATFMVLAALTTVAFLLSYLYYHYHAGTVGFQGQGWARAVYLAVLLSHTVLAAFVAPMVALVFYYAIAGRFVQHRRLARRTLPLWLYVSVTGVLIYLMLYVWFPG